MASWRLTRERRLKALRQVSGYATPAPVNRPLDIETFRRTKQLNEASQSSFYFCPALRRVARAAALASRAAARNKRNQIRAQPLRHGGDGLALRHLRRSADAGSRRECDGRGGGGAFGADGG